MTLEDVHIRYEDHITSKRASWVDYDPDNNWAAGLTLDKLALKSVTVDEMGLWKETIGKAAKVMTQFLSKRVQIGDIGEDVVDRSVDDNGMPSCIGEALKGVVSGADIQQSGLAVYCNTATHGNESLTGNSSHMPFKDPGGEEWKKQMSATIARGGQRIRNMTYLFGPQYIVVDVSIDKAMHRKDVYSRIHDGGIEKVKGANMECAVRIHQVRAHIKEGPSNPHSTLDMTLQFS